MNSEFLVKAKEVFSHPGYYSEEEIFQIHNVGIRLTKQIEETICKNGDIGIRRLFHNITELNSLYTHHKQMYFDGYKKGKRDDITAEMLTVLSEAIGQLLRLSFYYFPSESNFFEKEFEEHCKVLSKAIKRSRFQDVDLDKLKYTEPEPIKQADYFHLLAHTGIINEVLKKTDEETAKEIDPNVLSKNYDVLIKCNIELLFMYLYVIGFNVDNARAYINKYKNAFSVKEYQKPKAKQRISDLLAKINPK